MKSSDLADNRPALRVDRPDDRVTDTIDRLDTLRTEFLVDLSHQLRTPLTAMRLALDGLFAQLNDVMSPSQHNLARISHRNIERIISLVENQLDLLQMMAGERTARCCLVDLNALLSDVVANAAGDGARPGRDVLKLVGPEDNSAAAGPFFVLSDPKLLRVVFECLLGTSSPNVRRLVSVDFHRPSGSCRIDIRLDIGRHPATPARTGGKPEADHGVDHVTDFEYRACESLLALAGGSVEIGKDKDPKRVRICIPRFP